MSQYISQITAALLSGRELDRESALRLAADSDQQALWQGADHIRAHFHGSRFSLCAIINARSGRCSEDCRFCAQSGRHAAAIEEYDVIDADRALEIAAENDRQGVHRLSLVTSGRQPGNRLLDRLQEIYRQIDRTTHLKLCGSLGMLTRDKARRLQTMGLSRYHCNLEACRSYFPEVCTTHTWEEKAATIRVARAAGLSVCSGGIIGMGESMADRIDLALELRELAVDSIPLNIMTPIAGTPMADRQPPAVEEVLSTIALFRYLNPRATIRIAGGRQQLGSEQYRCFGAGANGAMVGNYLTTSGTTIDKDLRAFTALGFSFA
jgi:biotin synthase